MRRIMLSLLLLLGLLLVPSAAFAQDECTGEIDPESDFLTKSEAAMLDVESHTSTTAFDVSLINAPSLPAELVLNVTMDGSYALDPEVTRALTELGKMEDSTADAMVEDLTGLLVTLYEKLSLDMNFDLEISDDLGALIAGTSGAPAKMIPSALTVPFRMVDGFFYMNLDDVAAQIEGTGVEGWIGFDMATMMAESINASMAQMESGDMPTDMMSMSLGSSMAMQVALGETAKEYTSIEGLGISEVDGEEVCELEYTFDLAGFVSSPAFIEMIVAQMEMQMEMQKAMGGAEMPVTDEDMAMVTQMLPMFAPMLLSGLEFATVSSIGVEDGLVRASETRVEWDLGSVASMATALMQPGSTQEAPAAGESPFFSMHITSQSSAFNRSV